MKLRALGFAGIALAMCAIPATAHHSFAMFDAAKRLTVQGTVKQFQWTNPHAWILLMVPDADGKLQQWAIECVGTGGLARRGWVPKTLTPGMSVSVTIHPLQNGEPGGQFLLVTFPDGSKLGDPDTGNTLVRGQPAE